VERVEVLKASREAPPPKRCVGFWRRAVGPIAIAAETNRASKIAALTRRTLIAAREELRRWIGMRQRAARGRTAIVDAHMRALSSVCSRTKRKLRCGCNFAWRALSGSRWSWTAMYQRDGAWRH
jgi:hypothetical protein